MFQFKYLLLTSIQKLFLHLGNQLHKTCLQRKISQESNKRSTEKLTMYTLVVCVKYQVLWYMVFVDKMPQTIKHSMQFYNSCQPLLGNISINSRTICQSQSLKSIYGLTMRCCIRWCPKHFNEMKLWSDVSLFNLIYKRRKEIN